jgi:branched-chain amino acid transport system permease protein
MSQERDPRPAEEASAYVRAVEERAPANVALAGKGVGRPTSSGARLSAAVSGVLASKWLGLVVAVLALLLPFVNSSTYVIQIATDALIFIMLAVGLNIVVGFCGLLDLGYAAFFAIGAYTSGVLAKYGWPMIATIPAVVVAAVAGGLIIGGPTLRLRTDYLAIVTLGFGEIIRITANNLDFTGGPNGLYGIPDFGDFGLRPNIAVYWVCAAVVCVAVLFSSRLGRGRIGRAWRFVREDEDAAEAMGIHTYKVKFAAYIAGAVFGGLAGVLFAVHQTAISPPSFNFLWSALILMAVVLGGMGSTPGVVVGALVISLLPELLRGAENWRYLIFGVLLIIIMVFRPQGLLPARTGEPKRHQRRSSTGTGTASVDHQPGRHDASGVLLDVRDMAVSFGGVRAVDGLTFSVHEGEVLSVIGPNGAGKTSAFNCITGFYRPSGGSVTFADTDVTGKRPAVIAASGIARTFQNLRLFGDLTVLDNVRAGMHVRIKQNFLDAMLHTPRYWRAEDAATDEANRWLDFVGIQHDRTARIRNLPYGEQRRVEIARALAREPRMLLLDEPAAGLNHGEKAQLLDLLRRIADLGIAVVLIEHDMGLVMEVSERIVVLSYGKEIADGTPERIRSNPAVIEAYLGAEDEDAHLEAERIAARANRGGPEVLS